MLSAGTNHDGRLRDERIRGLDGATATGLSRVFKQLADETRLRIMYLLINLGECDVSTLCRLVGASQPAVSHHLALLRGAGLVASRRQGRHNFYYVTSEPLRSLIGAALSQLPLKSTCFRINDFVISHAPG